ncbi:MULTISPECIES: hypothetical protein [Listeria]|uniref:hypothetical protein n=1 Tax=Listeria TaxID=1637 RepID=UPI000B59528E|nr:MULTISPECIES: hypothetical protein [Listeria]
MGSCLFILGRGNGIAAIVRFNKGVPALYQGQRITINLNQPRFIAEIIAYVREQLDLKLLLGTVELDNGIELLRDIGYVFDYQKQ